MCAMFSIPIAFILFAIVLAAQSSNNSCGSNGSDPAPIPVPEPKTPYMFYCEGHAGESKSSDGGCGGPCHRYYLGTPTNCHPMGRICANINCLDTPADYDFRFEVCDSSMSFCNGPAAFHPRTDAEGRTIWNTVKTAYLYVECIDQCETHGQPVKKWHYQGRWNSRRWSF